MSFNFLYSNEQAQPVIEKLFLDSKEAESHPNTDIQFYARNGDPGHPKTFLFPKNFPINKKIIYSNKRCLQEDLSDYSQKGIPYKKVFEFFINEQGKIISAQDPKQTCSFFCVSSRGFLPGERVTCRFATPEGDFKIETSFIANPMIVKNKSETVFIEAELMIAIPAIYQFKFTGFQENEKIKTLSISGEERLKGSFKVSKDLMVANTPDVEGKEGGIGKNIFIRESGERIQINLPWGNELINYVIGDKIYKSN